MRCNVTGVLKILLILILLLSGISSISAQSHSIALFVPSEGPFWKNLIDYSKAAASNLEIDLDVLFYSSSEELLVKVEESCINGADGIIYKPYGDTGEKVLEITEKYKTAVFTIDGRIDTEDLIPRTKYKKWIGEMYSDVSNMTNILIQQLINQADENGISNYNILSILGSKKGNANLKRIDALEKYTKFLDEVENLTITSASFSAEKAAEVFEEEYKKNPDINIVWCATDLMARGVIDAVKNLGITKPIFIGGINWDSESIKAIEEKEQSVSVGGHFLEGSWAVLLLNDYFEGIDFSSEGTSFTTPVISITDENISLFSSFLSLKPSEINFKIFSRHYNRDLKRHDIDLFKVAENIQKEESSKLSKEEVQWIKDHPVIRVHNEKDWRPFNFYENGKPQGFSIDFMNYLAEKAGFEIEYISGKSWNEYTQMIQNKELDVMLNIAKSPGREEFLHFSDPYMVINPVLYVRKGLKSVSSVEELFGHKFAVPKGFFMEEILGAYDEIEIITVSDTRDTIIAVSKGEADFLFDLVPVVEYYANVLAINNLQPGGRLNIEAENPIDLHLGIRKDWDIFQSIINKSIRSINNQEFNDLRNEWMGISSDSKLDFTDDELSFLRSNPVLRVHNEMDWFPFNFNENRIPNGFSIDYMNILSEYLGVEIDYISGPSWSTFLDMLKNKELDIMLNIVRTRARENYTLFTDPYIRNPNVIISSDDNPYHSIEALSGKTIAVPKGFFYEEVLRENFPQIKRLLLEDTLDCLKAVKFGQADAALGEEAVAYSMITRNMLTGLQISGEAIIGDPDYQNLRLGIRDDYPLLYSAVTKAMGAVTPQQIQSLRDKWLVRTSFQFSEFEEKDKIQRSVLILIALIFLILSLIFFIVLKINRKKSISINFGSRTFRWLTLGGLSIILSVLIIIGLFLLEKNKNQLIESNSKALELNLENAEERFNLWVEEKKTYMELLGKDPELFRLTELLLNIPNDQKSLISSTVTDEIRKYFSDIDDQFSNIGFFIINKEYISVGSKRDENLGIANIIGKNNPELLSSVFQGNVYFVPPMISDVSLSEITGSEKDVNPQTMFFIGPIRNIHDKIIAAFTLRIDPSTELSNIFQYSSAEISSDTYAFSNNGIMLSESNFTNDLVKINLLEKDQKASMNLRISDPGINLYENKTDIGDNDKLPFTLMAQNLLIYANKGIPSPVITNVEGYRDYRGVRVYGSGVWNNKYKIGIITEIDKDEVLSLFSSLQLTVYSLLGFTIILTTSAILLVLMLGERSNKVLVKAREELEDKVAERTADLKILSKTVEQSPISIVITDPKGSIEYVNPKFEEITGYTSEEAIGKNPRVLNSGILPKKFYKDLWDTVLAGNEWHGEFSNRKKDGSIFWESSSISPLTSESGEIINFVAIKEDITEKKRVQTELALRNTLMTNLIDSPLDIIIFSLDNNYCYTAFNKNHRDEMKKVYDTDISIGMSMLEAVSIPEIRPQIKETLDRVLKGETIRIEVPQPEQQIVYDFHWNPIKETDGNIIGLSAFIRDITNQKELEKALLSEREHLKSSMERFRVLFDQAADAYLIVHKGRFTDCNQAAVNLLEYDSKEELLDLLPSDISPEYQPDGVKSDIHVEQMIKKAFEEGSQYFDWIHYKKGEIEIPVEVILTPMNLDNKSVLLVVLHDLTERKKMEKSLAAAKDAAEAATRAKSDFLANMSHEIRTPMNAIIGLDSLLSRTEMSDKQRDYVDKIGNSARNLLGIINDILDFSKIEAGKLEIENTSFDLNDVLSNLSSMVGSKARDKGLELVFNQDLNVPQGIVGDPLRLGQILLNLVNNAIKFTSSGEIVVNSKIVDRGKDSLVIRFEVKDTGIGLKEEQINKLFQSFSQADTSTTRKYGGTGLGLSISKRLTEMMGGEIGVESEYGKGCNFFFTVKMGIGLKKEKKIKTTPEDLKGLKVLVVDDNATARDVLSAYLEDFSFAVKSVGSGELAIRELIQSKASGNKDYDLVLMDYQMPGINGIETSMRIRNELENIEVPKIIMVTGFGREEIMKQADDIGLQGFLIKPVSPSMLYDTIMEVFGHESGIKDSLKQSDDIKPDGFDLIRGAKLLLVEDNEINQQVAKETLQLEGFYVDIADDGKIAVEKLYSNNNYDLVLMDLQMPVMDGYEATAEIRKNPDFDKLPIVAMTADAMTGVREQVRKEGMNGYVTKPINPKELWKTLVQEIEAFERELPEWYVDEAKRDKTSSFPEIEGFDTASGLKRTANNRELYEKLIKQFIDEYSDVTGRISELYENGKTEEAVREAHTVKGVAANLGAEELMTEMAEIEAKLKQNEDIGDLLVPVNEIISNLTSAVIDSGILKDNEADKKSGETISNNNMAEKLNEVIQALNKRKPKPAVEILESLKQYDISDEIRFKLNDASGFLGKYKMKDAVNVLESVIDTLK